MIPIAMAIKVSSRVFSTPERTGPAKKYWPTDPQPKPGLVTMSWTSMAASRSRMAVITHRAGWRRGTARISSGPCPLLLSILIGSPPLGEPLFPR